MCIVCEHQLYEEHRSAEAAPFDPCPDCGKFPSNDGGSCYHCFSVGNTIDECPECLGTLQTRASQIYPRYSALQRRLAGLSIG